MDDEVIMFGVQVRETGRKSFTLDYMFEGRRRRLYIGDFTLTHEPNIGRCRRESESPNLSRRAPTL